MGPMKHRGEIDISAQDTLTAVLSNGETNSSTVDECPVGNVSIASVTNTAEMVAITPEDDVHLTTISPITDASGIPSMKSISLDYFLWLVNRLSKRAVDENYFVPGSQRSLLQSYRIQQLHTMQYSPP
jgi:hypothetical protein